MLFIHYSLHYKFCSIQDFWKIIHSTISKFIPFNISQWMFKSCLIWQLQLEILKTKSYFSWRDKSITFKKLLDLKNKNSFWNNILKNIWIWKMFLNYSFQYWQESIKISIESLEMCFVDIGFTKGMAISEQGIFFSFFQ